MYQLVQLVGTQTAQCAMRIAECIAVMQTTIYPNPKLDSPPRKILKMKTFCGRS